MTIISIEQLSGNSKKTIGILFHEAVFIVEELQKQFLKKYNIAPFGEIEEEDAECPLSLYFFDFLAEKGFKPLNSTKVQFYK